MKRIISISTLVLISACQFNSSQNQKKIDSDGDGIVDSSDDCPDTFGLEEFDGCPDTDEDGIIDSEDDCSEEPGLEEYNGCPDSDGDGISDPNDQCPDEFGFEIYNGCPDFGSQTQNLTVQSCLEIITLNNDEKNEALKFLEKDLIDLISYKSCEITGDYILYYREYKSKIGELDRQIDEGYIQILRKTSWSQHLIVSKNGVYYLMQVLAGGECTMGTMKFDENSSEVQDVWVRESPNEEKFNVFKMKIVDKNRSFSFLENKINGL